MTNHKNFDCVPDSDPDPERERGREGMRERDTDCLPTALALFSRFQLHFYDPFTVLRSATRNRLVKIPNASRFDGPVSVVIMTTTRTTTTPQATTTSRQQLENALSIRSVYKLSKLAV